MSERRIVIPSLHGGLSHQPANLRHANQVEDAINCTFSVADGMSKRPGSQWIATLDANRPSFTDATWTLSTKTITATGAFANYTWAAGDHVYIRHFWHGVRWGLYEVASKTSDDAIVLTEDIADADVSESVIDSGWNTFRDYRLHIIERDDEEKYLVFYGDGQIRIFDLDGKEQIVRIVDDEAKRYLLTQPDGRNRGADADDIALATVADHTIVLNRNHIPRAATSDRYTFTEKDDVQAMFDGVGGYTDGDKFLARAAARGLPSGYYEYQAGSATFAKWVGDWVNGRWLEPSVYINTNANFGLQITDSAGTEYDLEVAINFASAASMAAVATEFQTALTSALSTAGGSGTVGVTFDKQDNRGRFTITSPYGGAGAKVRGPYTWGGNDLQWAEFHPFADVGRARYIDGKGASGGTLDIADQFTRITAPGQAGAVIDNTSMPVKLVRYTVGSENDAGQYFPGYWELDLIDWSTRLSGDSNSNPAPTIFQTDDGDRGVNLADVGFIRNRLVLAGGEHVVMSQAGDYFNLFLDDATNIIDSDPIDVSLSTDAVTHVEHVVGFRKSLLIFTKAGRQFELNSPEALTPTTAAITPSTSYQTIPIRPRPIGDFLYFASSRKDAAILYEYFYDDTRVSNYAADVSAHVHGLLPSDLRSIATSQNNQLVFCVPLDCDTIYVYASWWFGNEKVQSAWTKWVFNQDYEIIDIGVVQNDLYMMVRDNDNNRFYLEKIPIARQVL